MDQQAQQPAPQQKANNPMAIAGMVLGIVSVVICWWGWLSVLGLACGVTGLILSIKGRKSNVQRGLATAGLVCSIIGIVLAGIAFVCFVACVGTAAAVDSSLYY